MVLLACDRGVERTMVFTLPVNSGVQIPHGSNPPQTVEFK